MLAENWEGNLLMIFYCFGVYCHFHPHFGIETWDFNFGKVTYLVNCTREMVERN